MKHFLLEGAYDIHVHAFPDVVPRIMDLIQLGKMAIEYKMGGILFKDHTTSTTGRVYVLNHLLKSKSHFFSSLVLNAPVGFINPLAVESALRTGANIIYFPTYGAENHITKWGLGKPPTAFPVNNNEKGFKLLYGSEREGFNIDAILKMIASYDAVLGTGHLSPAESIELIKLAKRFGVKRILVTHASESVINMSPDQQKKAADMGAIIEHSFFAVTDSCPGKIRLEEIRDQIRHVGVSSCILSSDFGQVKNLPPVEGFLYYLEKMMNLGFSDEELRIMIHDNPQKLLYNIKDDGRIS